MNPCPRCGSTKVIERKSGFFAVIGLAIVVIFFFLSFLIPPLGIGGVIVGLGFLIFAPFARQYYHCKSCNRLFKVRN